MRLRSHHVALLTPFERKIYAPLIGKIDYQQEKRDFFISGSQHYIEGDENVLPFPERSKRGVMLLTLCQQLAQAQSAAVFLPSQPHLGFHIKRKLLEQGAEKAYAVPPVELLAALYGAGKQPFKYFRENPAFTLPGLDMTESPVVCALNPPPASITQSMEYTTLGVILAHPMEGEEEEGPELNELPLFAEAAHAGLVEVSEIDGKRFWLTREKDPK